LLSAREGSYFKTEQEDDLSAYRRRRIREGALKPHAGALLEGEVGDAVGSVSDTKLAEIHAQEARLSASVRESRRSVTSQMPPMSTAGYRGRDRSFAGTYRVPSARGAKWGGLAAVDGAGSEMVALLPEETAAMRKSKAVADKALAAGTRALMYGSLIALAGVAGGGLIAANALDIRDRDDLRAALLRLCGPSVETVRLRLEPWKLWFETAVGAEAPARSRGDESGVRWIEDSVIVRDLRRKFRMRRRGDDRARAAEADERGRDGARTPDGARTRRRG
jgi:hypothetical protein